MTPLYEDDPGGEAAFLRRTIEQLRARLAALEQERDVQEAECVALNKLREAAERQRDEYKDAAAKYGTHLHNCHARWVAQYVVLPEQPCTCGWDRALLDGSGKEPG